MDRIAPRKKWTKRKLIIIISTVIITTIILGSYLITAGNNRLNVDTERLNIAQVKSGKFQEFIAVSGNVMPVSTIYLDAIEGGRVEERFVEDGSMVMKDQPILRLSNTDLELSLSNQETAVFDVLTQMQNTRNNADQNTIRQLNQMAEVDNALAEAERVYKLDKYLYDEQALAAQELKSAENNYRYQLRRRKLTQETLSKDSLSVNSQARQMRESYSRMQNALSLMRRKVSDLIVKAPVNGQLTSLDAEIGQSKNKGERLGQVDVITGFKVRAAIDEHFISRVFPGLSAEYTSGAKTYKLVVKKVFTQVNNGSFDVDLEFSGEVPSGMRRGQTLPVRLALGDETQALLVPKGGFYQQTGGNWIFKMSKDGRTAFKADIQLGRQNPEYYEVISGLQPGDRVVISGYENYGKMEELILK